MEGAACGEGANANSIQTDDQEVELIRVRVTGSFFTDPAPSTGLEEQWQCAPVTTFSRHG